MNAAGRSLRVGGEILLQIQSCCPEDRRQPEQQRSRDGEQQREREYRRAQTELLDAREVGRGKRPDSGNSELRENETGGSQDREEQTLGRS